MSAAASSRRPCGAASEAGFGARARGSRGRLLERGRAQACLRVGAAARELEPLGLEAAAHLARVAEGGPSHGAVALEDAVRPRGRRADEALVERASVLVGAARGVRHVPVAHPAAGRNGGHDLVETVGIHQVLLQSVSWPLTLRRGMAKVGVCGCFVTKLVLGRGEVAWCVCGGAGGRQRRLGGRWVRRNRRFVRFDHLIRAASNEMLVGGAFVRRHPHSPAESNEMPVDRAGRRHTHSHPAQLKFAR